MNYAEVNQKLYEILHLDTAPVAITMYEDQGQMPRKPMNYKLNLCQLVSIARYQQRSNTGVPEKMICSMGAACVGLIEIGRASCRERV